MPGKNTLERSGSKNCSYCIGETSVANVHTCENPPVLERQQATTAQNEPSPDKLSTAGLGRVSSFEL